MASCRTAQWAADAPYVKLTIIRKALTTSNVTFDYRLEYISEKAITSEGLKNFTIFMAGTAVASGTFDLNNKTGTNFVGSNTVVLPITSAQKSVSFKVAFTFGLLQPDGSIIDVLEASGSIPVSTSVDATPCGIPSIVRAVDSKNNIIDVSCLVGANGTSSTAEGVELFITCDGSEPSLTNYKYKYVLWGNAGNKVSTSISFADLPEASAVKIFGNTYANTVKISARTFGDVESTYNSAMVYQTVPFTWHGRCSAPTITVPERNGRLIGPNADYRVVWEPGGNGINNSVAKYSVAVNNLTTGRIVATYSTVNLYCDIPSNIFTANSIYRFDVSAIGTYGTLGSVAASSGPLTIKTVTKLSAPVLCLNDSTTIPSIEHSEDKIYVDIGSGNVLKISWDTPATAGNIVDSYKLYILYYDCVSASYKLLYSENVGNVNEFYVKSSIFSSVSQAFLKIQVYIEALSKYGTAYSSVSNMVFASVSKGSGIYVKVSDGYSQPIMKRALAFTQLPCNPVLVDGGTALTDDYGEVIYTKTSSVQDEGSGWALMQEFYVALSKGAPDTPKAFLDANGAEFTDAAGRTLAVGANSFVRSDIMFEILMDENGEPVLDNNDEYIYVL
jgi:hypothetical protein